MVVRVIHNFDPTLKINFKLNFVSVFLSDILTLKVLIFVSTLKVLMLPIIYSDNLGATNFCANHVFHSRIKHLALDYHFVLVREKVNQGQLQVNHISTKDQLVYALTQPLS